MISRDDFRVVEGGRADDDPSSQDDEDALLALADVIAQTEGETDPAIAQRALHRATEIMGCPVSDQPPSAQ